MVVGTDPGQALTPARPITNGKSALGERAAVVMAVDHTEDNTSFLSMISRMLQLLLIDIMSVGISLGGPDEKQDIDQRRLLISRLDS